jgi:mannose-6-phosphate isomerase-like protein (cupin superfamily)
MADRFPRVTFLPRRAALVLLLAAGLALAATLLVRPGGATSQATATREALGAAVNPRGAQGRTLALARVTVPAGAVLAKHHHTGTQVAHIVEGTLTYQVASGHVDVMRQGAADAKPTRVRRIGAGQTGSIKAGQWIVEEPSVHHTASNRGTARVVIYLTSLLPNGDPPSVAG